MPSTPYRFLSTIVIFTLSALVPRSAVLADQKPWTELSSRILSC
jgi:hypothetical protein